MVGRACARADFGSGCWNNPGIVEKTPAGDGSDTKERQGASMVQIEHVEKIYRTGTQEVHALQGIDCIIGTGELVAFAGPSGSGKTTLLNLIGCLDSITSGHILLEGRDLAKLDKKGKNAVRRSMIGFIFQNYNLIPVMTAVENVELALSILPKEALAKAGCPNGTRGEIRDRANMILAEVGLDGLQGRKPNELSGGQQQRISIARALVKRPSVILADEPTANLDSTNSRLILDLIVQLNETYGITCVFASHDQRVLDYTRRSITLEDGKIV